MPLIRVGAAGGTTTFTPPAHKIGDLFIAFAFRDGSTTNPTLPSGWTNITNTYDGTSCSITAGYKIAVSTAETSGTWTNASRTICIVYRGQLNTAVPIGTFTGSNGTSNTVTYGARALTNPSGAGSSWFVAFAGHVNVDTTLETPPSGMSLVLNQVDAVAEVSAFDTNRPTMAGWPSTNVTITGTAGAWVTFVIEIRAQGLTFENYKFVDAGDGISVTEKIY